MQRFDVLIVGAGQSGAQTAIALRQNKFEGAIGLLGDEPEIPYERPPLSKEYLAADRDFARMLCFAPQSLCRWSRYTTRVSAERQ